MDLIWAVTTLADNTAGRFAFLGPAPYKGLGRQGLKLDRSDLKPESLDFEPEMTGWKFDLCGIIGHLSLRGCCPGGKMRVVKVDVVKTWSYKGAHNVC